MTHFAYITHILYCTLYKLQTTCLCVKYFVKNLHRAETIYTGGARGARDKYQVWGRGHILQCTAYQRRCMWRASRPNDLDTRSFRRRLLRSYLGILGIERCRSGHIRCNLTRCRSHLTRQRKARLRIRHKASQLEYTCYRPYTWKGQVSNSFHTKRELRHWNLYIHTFHCSDT